MSERPVDFASCPHDRGPGITVCLRCRAESHRKAAASRNRLAGRLGVGIVVALIAAVAGNSAVSARGASLKDGAGAKGPDAERTERFQVAQAGTAEAGHVTRSASPAAPAIRTLAPAIEAGRTDMPDGRYLMRTGDSVSVHFDTPVFRTRRQDKFEQVVRTTLPAVYGAFADSVLASIPAGALVAGGSLLTELPVKGLPLPARDGWRLTLWPGTRPGHDGPLVVSYRVTLARAQ